MAKKRKLSTFARQLQNAPLRDLVGAFTEMGFRVHISIVPVELTLPDNPAPTLKQSKRRVPEPR